MKDLLLGCKKTWLLWLVCLGAFSGCGEPSQDDPQLDIYAAASTQHVVERLAQAFSQERGVPVRLNFASSSTLARQIHAGAPADVYISANTKWMDYLESGGHLQADSRVNLVANRLVLIASVKNPPSRMIKSPNELAHDLGKIALGDPEHVPAGIYAKQALRSLGLWDSVQPRVVAAANVRSALNFVVTGEVPLGIVYATDARLSDAVSVLLVFPQNSHSRIVYPMAALEGASPDAHDFIAYMQREQALKIYEQAGFSLPIPSP